MSQKSDNNATFNPKQLLFLYNQMIDEFTEKFVEKFEPPVVDVAVHGKRIDIKVKYFVKTKGRETE